MPVPVQSPQRLCFRDFELDLTSGELHKDGQKVPLPPKAFEVLRSLVERPGEVVTREELRSRLWAADTFVEFDDSLNHAVKKLRQALGDSAENPQFIETLPRYGYRFIASTKARRQRRRARSVEPPAAAVLGVAFWRWWWGTRVQRGRLAEPLVRAREQPIDSLSGRTAAIQSLG